ncbi:MAG: hypothetical protein L6R41_006073 [Letrouitia leprolyta]|nr:MAG: hypothetical protein L6R41_006073 [Letrouitia leprolyta]
MSDQTSNMQPRPPVPPRSRDVEARSPLDLSAPLRIGPPSGVPNKGAGSSRRLLLPGPPSKGAAVWLGSLGAPPRRQETYGVKIGNNSSMPFVPGSSERWLAPPIITPPTRQPREPTDSPTSSPTIPIGAPIAQPAPTIVPHTTPHPPSSGAETAARTPRASSSLPIQIFLNVNRNWYLQGQADFTRLDLPNEIGRWLCVLPSGHLSVMVRHQGMVYQGTRNVVNPDERLPNWQHEGYPMVVQIGGVPCILHGPHWEMDMSKPLSGDESYLGVDERAERDILRARACRDMEQYGSPAWLTQDVIDEV